jgi:hypothetical protein
MAWTLWNKYLKQQTTKSSSNKPVDEDEVETERSLLHHLVATAYAMAKRSSILDDTISNALHDSQNDNNEQNDSSNGRRRHQMSSLQFGIILTDINTAAAATGAAGTESKDKSIDELILERLRNVLTEKVDLISSLTIQQVAIDWSTYHNDGNDSTTLQLFHSYACTYKCNGSNRKQ